MIAELPYKTETLVEGSCWSLSVSISFPFGRMLYRAGDWFMVGRHKALR